MRARGVCSRNRLLGVCLSLLCMEALHPALAQPAAMVKDINTTLDPSFALQPQAMVAVGSRVFLSGTAEGIGVELWTSDGTSAGTVLVKDIWPGAGSSNPTNLVAMGGIAYFFADDGVHGQELWRSDGAEAGTYLVKDVQPGSGSSSPRNLIVAGSTLYFSAYSAGSGQELWTSDGTASGTVLVKDICPGEQCGGNPSYLTAVGSTVYFSAWDSANGTELWKSDGTDAGTVLVKDICSGGGCGGFPTYLTAIGSTVYFSAWDSANGWELWKSDGTDAGTVLVKDICPGPSCNGNPSNLTNIAGTLFFTASNATNGTELWKSDGTTAGTVMVKDICAGSCSSNAGSLTNVGGILFFRASDGGNGAELWKSDGSDAGTVLVKDICSGSCSSSPSNLVVVNGTLYFSANDGTNGNELWKSDGTPGGTVMVRDICPSSCGSNPSLLTNVNGTLFLRVGWAYGVELWKSNGTDAGTVVVRDFTTLSSFPSGFVELGGLLYFAASDGAANRELFKSDGTATGTSPVIDPPIGGPGVQGPLIKLGTTIFYAGNDGTNGTELWKSDGTASGTAMVKDIWGGGGGSNPSSLTPVGSTLFFVANDGYSGNELWKSNGSEVGTVLVKDICAGTCNGNPSNLVDVNGTLFFTANDGSNGAELWRSDGTAVGTVMVKDICPGPCGSSPSSLVNVNGTLFFRAIDNTNGWELWKSDGTSAGTVMVKDICGGGCSSYPDLLTNVNGTLFFAAWGPDRELWKSDGTAAGTVLVKDICPGTCESSPAGLVAAANRLFFRADDGTHGMELWVSVGTAAGTTLVKDINAGSASSIPRPIRAVGSSLLFAANDGTSGEELWKSDGTAAGTFRVQDINPGPGHSNVTQAIVVGDRVFFNADDGVHGQELWALGLTDLAVSKGASPDPVLQGNTITYTVTVTNGGSISATGVRLIDVLPSGVTFVSATPASGTCSFASGTVTCEIGTVASAATLNVTILATVNTGFVGALVNSVRVSADEVDPNGSNDVATASVTVPGPSPARNLTATATSATSIVLGWADPGSTQTGIRLERSTDGVSFTSFTTVGAHVTTTADSPLSAGTLYYYRVVAVQSGTGESLPSNVAAARTFPAVAAKVCATRVSPHHTWSRFPAVAWNGTQWGSVRQVRQPGRELDDIVFQLLDATTGQPVGSPVNVSDDDMSSSYPTIRWNGSRFAVVWYGGPRGPYLALLDASGTKVRGNVAVLDNDSSQHGYLNMNLETAIVWTGSEWGMVLQVVSGTVPDLTFFRFSPEGDRIGAAVRLTNTPETEGDISIAWNGTEYGLSWVWSGTPARVYFQKMQADGTLIGTPTLVRENSNGVATTSTVWNGTGWAVVWTDFGADSAGWVNLARLNGDGTMNGAPSRVSPDYDPDFPPEQMLPFYDELPLLFAKPAGGYVVFTNSVLNTTGAYEIGRYETDATGNRIGTRTILSANDKSHSAYHRAGSDGTRYLVIYNDNGPGTLEVADLIAGASGSPIAGPTVLSSGGSPGNGWMVMNSGAPLTLPVGDGFVSLWSEPVLATSNQVFGKVYGGSGNVAATLSPLFTRSFRARPGGVGVGDTFALAWKDSPNNVVFARYDALGSPVVGETVVATGQSGRPGAALAFSGEVYGLVWFLNTRLAFQRVAPSGALVGTQTTLPLASTPNNVAPQIAWTGSGWAIVYTRNTDLEYVFLDPSGAVSVAPVALTASANPKDTFSLAWSGQKLGLAWVENLGVTPPGPDIYFTAVALNGVKDFAPVNVASSPVAEGSPSLYWDTDRFRLVHTYGQPLILREIGIYPNGTVTAGERLLSNRGGANSVAFNGATLGVTWMQLADLYFETTACTADTTPPSCPPASAVMNGQTTTLGWTQAADAESGIYRYNVYRDGYQLAELLPTTTSLVDGGFLPGVTHTFEVRALNGAYLESTGCTPFSPSTDLSITKSDGSAVAVPGASISYTITVTNAGPSTVTSVTLTDPVPAAILSPVFTPGTGAYVPGTGAWTGLSLGPGQGATLTLSGTVDPLARGSLANTATVATTASVVDSNPANNSATDTDALTPQADLSVSMTDSPDPVNQGATLTYSLTIANAGPSTATGIVLTDTLPAGVTFVSATPGSPTCTQASGMVTCHLANIAPGSSTLVSILVRPNLGTVGTITNTAAITGTETDPNGANNTASAQTTVPGPSPARNLLVTGRTTTSISLNWTDPQGTETGFRIERSTNGTSWSPIDNVGPNVSTYTDPGRAPATLYYYRVVALQSGVGEAPPSNVAAETTFSTTAAKICATALSTGGTSIGKPSVARGASQWAMAWHERPAGEMSTHVYFQKLDDATGAFVGSRVRVSSSTGSSSNPTLRWNGTNYGVLWAESMKAPTGESTSQWRFALLDAAGARLKGDISAIPAGRSVHSGPRAEMPLVWNGSGWGIFTNEEGTPPSDLAFYRLDANGYPVGSRIQLTSTPDRELSQSAAWNGTEYGLAWIRFGTAGGSFQVYFQRVSAAGAFLGSPALLWSNTTATGFLMSSTSVLWDGSSWVVAFTDSGPDPEAPEPVYLRRLNPDGSVAGAAVRLSPDYDPDFAPGDLVPIYDDSPLLLARPGGYEVFTTSFLNSVANWAICAYQADGSLNRVGSRAVVSVNDGRSSAGARVATDGTRYLVAYDETRLGSNELADLLVGNSGLLAGPTSLTAGHINGGANPVALPLGDGFAALWTDTSTGTSQIRAKLYDGTGTLVATRAPLSSRSVRGKPGSVSVGTTFALAWKDASNTLVFGRYDATGAALISESVVATGAGGPPYVGMAFSGESYGLAFAKGKNVLFQRVAPSGSLVGSPTTVTTVTGTTLLGQPGLQIQWVGTGWALLWRQDGNTDSDLFYAFLDPSGAVVTPPIQVTFTPQAENGFQLLWNGSVLALTWYDYRYPDPPGGVILFTVLDLGGIKAFAPVVVVATPYDDTYPSLYWDQDRFRLVHFAGSPGTLREIAVFPNGTVAPGERMLAPRGGPSGIAWNGATLGVAWAQLGEVYFETTACLADATPPPCPSATASGDASSITVSFSPVTDPESGIWRYDVYRDGAMVAELLPTITSYVDGGNLPGVAHVYEVRALNGAYFESSGCSVVSLCPVAPIAANGGPYCAGATVALTASSISGATYAWTGPNSLASAVQNPTIPSATTAATGLYSVTATLNGCTSPVGSTTVVVNAMPATPVIAAPGSVFANAAGLTASVTIHSGSTYSWGITNGTITAGALSSQVTFTAGPTGPVVLTAVETSVSGCHSSQASVSIPVLTGSTRFNPVAPCRLFDTRNAGGADAALPALAAGETRTFVIGSRCGLPASAKSLSVNQTVTGPTAPGELLLYRADLPSAPTASSLSFRAGITRANNGMLELAHDGSGTFKVFNNSTGTVHFILDVSGYFQ